MIAAPLRKFTVSGAPLLPTLFLFSSPVIFAGPPAVVSGKAIYRAFRDNYETVEPAELEITYIRTRRARVFDHSIHNPENLNYHLQSKNSFGDRIPFSHLSRGLGEDSWSIDILDGHRLMLTKKTTHGEVLPSHLATLDSIDLGTIDDSSCNTLSMNGGYNDQIAALFNLEWVTCNVVPPSGTKYASARSRDERFNPSSKTKILGEKTGFSPAEFNCDLEFPRIGGITYWSASCENDKWFGGVAAVPPIEYYGCLYLGNASDDFLRLCKLDMSLNKELDLQYGPYAGWCKNGITDDMVNPAHPKRDFCITNRSDIPMVRRLEFPWLTQ